MRLLERDDTGEFRLMKDLPNDAIPEVPPYAILSHTWGDEEVLFKDLADGTAKNKAGYAKIRFCGDQAWLDGLKYFWVDTCCIDRSDSAELQHALNSMFRWYRSAAKCYVYLADVSTHQQDDGPDWKPVFRQSRWFTRGWTLQELIAPTIVEFFSIEGKCLGDKKSLGQEIHDITGIPLKALYGSPLSDYGVAERMRWIEKRNTKYEEDKAYSLFGIFDVHIPVLYGEGKEKAFDRLQEKIDKNSHRLAKLWSTDPRSANPRDPRVEKERIELVKGGLLADAYRWVFDNPDFNRWRQLPESRLLWIKGDPGKGKTMLLCGLIDELERPVIADGGNLAYFFCQATDSRINNATAVLRGLIYLLAHRQPRLVSHLPENTYPSDDAMAWIVLSKVLWAMLGDPNLKATYLVVDALDECVTDLPRLLKLVAQTSSTSSYVKWIVSSRNWPQIEEQLGTVAQQSRLSLELNAESVATAVSVYIRHKVLYLSQLKRYDSATENAVHNYLSSNANGTFLWVALVCQVLADPNIRRWQTLTKLRVFPPGLDSLYARMMEQIIQSDYANLCKRILAVVTIVRRPISLRELPTFVEMPYDIPYDLESLEDIINICGSFLTLREQTVYFVHQSAKDFLLGRATHQASRDAFNWVFPLGLEDLNRIILLKSLNVMSTVLRRDIYGLKVPGFSIDEVQTPSSDPLATARYSCVFWVNHLCDSISNKNTIQRNIQDVVQTFLEQKYLYWLEALSLLRALPEGILAIRQLDGLITLEGHDSSVRSVAFSPDGQRLVSGSDDTTIKIWDPASGNCLQTLQGHDSWVRSVAFSPDGQRLVSGSDDTTIKIWDPASGNCLQTLRGHDSSVHSVAFSPDGQRLVSGSDDTAIKIWDPASGNCLQILRGHDSSVRSVAFSPDGQRLVSGSDDTTIKIWDPASGSCLQTLRGHNSWVHSVAFSPDGQRLVSGSYDKTIKVWDPASGSCLQILRGHNNWVYSVAFSPDSQRLVSGSYDTTIKIWDPASGSCLQTLRGHNSSVRSVAFSPDSQRLVSGSDDTAIKIWDPTSGSYLQTLRGHDSWVRSVAFSPDGQRLVSGSDDKTIKIWDPVSGSCLQTLRGHDNWVRSVAFSPDSQRLVSGSDDKTIKIWDPASGSCLQTLRGHNNWVYSVAFSPDGQRLVSGSYDTTIKIWDPASGSCLQTFRGHDSWVRSVAFSPDSQRLVSGSDDKTIKIWDPASGSCLQTLRGHNSWVRSVAFSPDGQRLVSGSDDTTIKIWDPASGSCLQSIDIGTSVTHVSFDHTGSYIITDIGCIEIAGVSTERPIRPDDPGIYRYGLGQEKSWITCNGRNVLWLPPEYRPECSAAKGRMLSIGCASGRVITIGFTRDI
ncbi:hypothetical protein MFIFM68171_02018 [Madurella fahalii]|uniref:NACHT domain-containing protein n=1 Tax=Madurella fahalii TaxID=1157608 RepID=A0ABQ0G222_9PEZI